MTKTIHIVNIYFILLIKKVTINYVDYRLKWLTDFITRSKECHIVNNYCNLVNFGT